MNEVIIYLLKAMIIQGVFYLIYWLCFRKTALHAINRLFLLLALGLSFVIPFIELPYFNSSVPEVIKENSVIFWLSDPTVQAEYMLEPISTDTKLSFATFFPWVSVLVTLVLIARSAFYLKALQRLKKKSESVSRRWFTIYKTSQTRPFSFFKNVFIPQSLFGSNAFNQVLAHECVHVRRFHSLDRLALDFVVSLFWFNPFIYCYRNALIEIHEYEADEGVLKQYNDPVLYQEVLFSQLQSHQYTGLVSHFNFQLIKKRIVMMNKQKKRNGWVYGMTLPVTLMMVFAFSSKEAMKPLNNVGNEISTFIGPLGDLQEYTENVLQNTNEPSILPLKESDMVRMTSGFGMRMHPVKKERKMHLGMDFSCKVGSEVIATADGKVSILSNKPDGYGKLVVVDHGNGYKTFYAQLSQFKAKQGDVVKRGQVIALSGNSGMSTAPHLHYEVMKGDKRVNPAPYIRNYKFSQKELKPQVKEVKEEASPDKSKQKLIEKEHELARREAELAAREMELARAREMLALEEMEKAQEMFLQAQELEMISQQKALEAVERDKMREEEAMERKLGSMKVIRSAVDNALYLLDGKVIESEMAESIDLDDIKSISVLKGESAKEKYGKKGENGVIEIDSKKSPKGKNKTKLKNKVKKKDKS